MKTFKIHLIRHGISEGSEEGLYIGHTDAALTPMGKKQLTDMMSDYEYPAVDAVISSPLDRCLETAKILYPDRSPMIFDGLIEYDFGEFEGSTAEELKTDPAFGEWLSGGEDAGAPFGETNGEFRNRVCKCFLDIVDGIMKTGVGSVAIITHGGVIMTLMQYFALPELPMHEWLMPNGCGYTLRLTPTLWMAGQKVEAIEEIPATERKQENYYDGWDYYPDITDEDFDISEYINE